MDIKKIKELREIAYKDWQKAGDVEDAAAYEGMVEAYDEVLKLVDLPESEFIHPKEDGTYTKNFDIKIETKNHWLYPAVFTEGPGFENVESLKEWLKNSYNLLQMIKDALEEDNLLVDDDAPIELHHGTDAELGYIPYALGDLVNFIQVITELIKE